MAGNTLLQADSCHTKHTTAAVPYGELVRARRACSNEQSFAQEKSVIIDRLTKQGYSIHILDKAVKRIDNVTQKELLLTRDGRPKRDKPSVVFSTPFSKDFNSIRKIIQKYLPVLEGDDKLSHILQDGVNIVAKENKTPSLFSSCRSLGRTLLSEKGFFR